MSQSSFPNKDSALATYRQGRAKSKLLEVEVIRALTPIFIASIGAVISVVVMIAQPDESQGFITLATTAIAGAAGLAQPQKEQKEKEDQLP